MFISVFFRCAQTQTLDLVLLSGALGMETDSNHTSQPLANGTIIQNLTTICFRKVVLVAVTPQQ